MFVLWVVCFRRAAMQYRQGCMAHEVAMSIAWDMGVGVPGEAQTVRPSASAEIARCYADAQAYKTPHLLLLDEPTNHLVRGFGSRVPLFVP